MISIIGQRRPASELVVFYEDAVVIRSVIKGDENDASAGDIYKVVK